MDESHRLKPMIEGYDKTLFDSLYKDTKDLRHKLAFEIDSRKFGVDYNEVLSWFDVKFLYVFNKYYGNDKIKGFIINSLKTYKARIVKSSYQPKFELHNSIDVTEVYEDISIDNGTDPEKEELLSLTLKYFKERLSDDAMFLLEIELNPPPYILHKLANSDKAKIPKPSAELIAEYLGIEDSDFALEYIARLRSEIKDVTKQAREYFSIKK